MNSKSTLRNLSLLLLLLVSTTLTSCDLVGDVLEFSFWVTIIVVLIVVAIIIWIVRKIF